MAVTSDRHSTVGQSRYERMKRGLTVEDIAREDGVSVRTVRASIEFVQLKESLNTQSEMERQQMSIINSVVETERRTLKEALTATRIIERDGKQKSLPDWETRTKAMDTVTQRIKAVKERPAVTGGGNQTQVIVNPTPTPTISGISYRSFEDRLRQHIQGRPVAALPESTSEDTQQIEDSELGDETDDESLNANSP